MWYTARNFVLTLAVTSSSSVLASRRHPRYYSSSHHPSYVGGDKNRHTGAGTIIPEYEISRWPSNTDDCVRTAVRPLPDAPAWYLHDGKFYEKSCLKTLVYLVEPEDRAACRTQSDCHYSRGYDDGCLIQLSLDHGFDFDFEEMRRQELEWKGSVCHGKTLDQCGRDHSSWWRSRFPSSRDDCHIRGQTDKKWQVGSGDNWVPWSVGPRGTLYDNDCLMRYANRLGMENPGNCTQINTREVQEAAPVELPKTLVYATGPSGIQPHLEFPTAVTNPSGFAPTPVTYIPTLKDSFTDITPEPLATGIPDGLRRERNDISPPPVRTPTEIANALPTSLQLVSRTQDSAADEWSCMWDVDVALPDPAPGMFDTAFGNTTVYNVPLVAQRVGKGELEDLSECSDSVGEETRKGLTG